ncbi:MAG TPA: DUF58 domain-containing protein [Tepidisphaeraceae bacterium]|jgi:uncharacterized protein (DUF58 family)
MSETAEDYRQYLDPRVLARIGSLELRARLIVEGLMTGSHRSPYQGVSVEFAQHRPYAIGDDIRHVDWKVLAKTDRVYLKQYRQETNLQLVCVVDASESMAYGSNNGPLTTNHGPSWTKFDHATSIAASLAYLAIQQQDSVGLAVFDNELRRYLKASNSPTQWKQIVQELTQQPRVRKTQMGRILQQLAEKLTHRSLVLIVSDFFDDLESIEKAFRLMRYRRHELIVMQVLDPAEIEFPFEQVTMFKGLEEAGELLTEPRALREAYLQQLKLATDRLRQMCRSIDADFEIINSGVSLEATLGNFLAQRAARMK